MTWPLNITALSTPRFLRRGHRYPSLLAKAELNTLRQLAQQSLSTALDVDLEVHQRLLGERLSPFVKQGYEFAEIRPYQVGDSIRFINWRRYASTGQLYINRFVEERRPQCWLVMDRRSSMRFGTRVRLKVAQAAMLAIYHIYKAHYHQLAVGGVVLDAHSQWFDARTSSLDLQTLQQHIIAPCTPAATPAHEPQLDAVLRQLSVRCQPGCLIFIISDFRDLHANSSATLAALSAAHRVSALHIIDPVEAALPEHGIFDLIDNDIAPIQRVDCNNASTRHAIDSALQASLQATERLLTQHDLHYRRIYSDENLLDSNPVTHGR